jgi:hypothetical protein
LPIKLSALGIFSSPSVAIWVAPVVTPELLGRHAALQGALPEMEPQAHYRTGAWMPHVTLSGPLTNPEMALGAFLPVWQPLTGLLNRLELVRFRPVEVLQSHDLSIG